MGSIWELMAAQRLDMIGRREGKSGYRIEDRLMLGRRATMLRLESAYAHYTSGTLRATAGANSGIAAPSKCRGSQLLTRREPQPLAQASHFLGLPPRHQSRHLRTSLLAIQALQRSSSMAYLAAL